MDLFYEQKQNLCSTYQLSLSLGRSKMYCVIREKFATTEKQL